MRYGSLLDLKGVGKKTFEALEKAGVETLEDLKLEDIRRLCQVTGLSETLLQDILLRAELQTYGVPPDAAEALAASDAIGRAGELAAFDSEEIQALLTKGVKPGVEIDVSIEAIETWMAHVPRLSLDEDTTRGLLMEKTATALHDEAEPALRTEDPVVSKREIEALILGLEGTLQQLTGKMQTLVARPEERIELANVQAIFSSLQADIQTTLVEVMEKVEPDLGILMREDEGSALADEEIEPEAQIQVLSRQLATIKGQLAELEERRIALDEEFSPTVTGEEEPIAPRGE